MTGPVRPLPVPPPGGPFPGPTLGTGPVRPPKPRPPSPERPKAAPTIPQPHIPPPPPPPRPTVPGSSTLLIRREGKGAPSLATAAPRTTR